MTAGAIAETGRAHAGGAVVNAEWPGSSWVRLSSTAKAGDRGVRASAQRQLLHHQGPNVAVQLGDPRTIFVRRGHGQSAAEFVEAAVEHVHDLITPLHCFSDASSISIRTGLGQILEIDSAIATLAQRGLSHASPREASP